MSEHEIKLQNIQKWNVTINAIRTISMWACTLILSFKLGIIYRDLTTRFAKYDIAVQDVKDLKEWKQLVEAYYKKPTNNN